MLTGALVITPAIHLWLGNFNTPCSTFILKKLNIKPTKVKTALAKMVMT